jgi:hypothetical protein
MDPMLKIAENGKPRAVESPNVIDEFAAVAVNFLSQYGWYIVIACLLWYNFSPQVYRLRDNLSLAHANRASRVKILDEDRKRARMIQQLDVYKANRIFKDSESGTVDSMARFGTNN